MMRPFLFFALIIILTATTLASPICDCFDYPDHSTAFKQAKAVFVGKVLRIDKNAARPEGLENEVDYSITFQIDKRWKGPAGSTLVAWQHAEHALCSHWQFEEGVKYLVYAGASRGNLIVSGWCSRTRPLETKDAKALSEFKELDKFRRPSQ
jgi:hypothetical protein